MTALKDFLDAVNNGHRRSDLFIFRTAAERDDFLVDAMNEMGAANLNPLVRRTNMRIDVNGSTLYLAVAHPDIGYRYAGIQLTGLHGEQLLAAFGPRGDEAAMRLLCRVQVAQ